MKQEDLELDFDEFYTRYIAPAFKAILEQSSKYEAVYAGKFQTASEGK